jgi:hypothetical protein
MRNIMGSTHEELVVHPGTHVWNTNGNMMMGKTIGRTIGNNTMEKNMGNKVGK